jgi:hypothetical protein
MWNQNNRSRSPSFALRENTSVFPSRAKAAPPRMDRRPRRAWRARRERLFLSLAEEWPTVHTTVSHGLHCAGVPSPVRLTPDVQWDREPSALPGPRRSVAASDGPLTPHGFQNGLWPLTPTAQSVPTVSQFFCRMTCSSFFGMSGSGQLPGSFHGRPSHGTCKKFSSGGGP